MAVKVKFPDGWTYTLKEGEAVKRWGTKKDLGNKFQQTVFTTKGRSITHQWAKPKPPPPPPPKKEPPPKPEPKPQPKEIGRIYLKDKGRPATDSEMKALGYTKEYNVTTRVTTWIKKGVIPPPEPKVEPKPEPKVIPKEEVPPKITHRQLIEELKKKQERLKGVTLVPEKKEKITFKPTYEIGKPPLTEKEAEKFSKRVQDFEREQKRSEFAVEVYNYKVRKFEERQTELSEAKKTETYNKLMKIYKELSKKQRELEKRGKSLGIEAGILIVAPILTLPKKEVGAIQYAMEEVGKGIEWAGELPYAPLGIPLMKQKEAWALAEKEVRKGIEATRVTRTGKLLFGEKEFVPTYAPFKIVLPPTKKELQQITEAAAKEVFEGKKVEAPKPFRELKGEFPIKGIIPTAAYGVGLAFAPEEEWAARPAFQEGGLFGEDKTKMKVTQAIAQAALIAPIFAPLGAQTMAASFAKTLPMTLGGKIGGTAVEELVPEEMAIPF